MTPENQGTSDGLLNAVNDGVAAADSDGKGDEKAKQKEYDAVKKNVEEYDKARAFDKFARRQYAVDRRYAAGTADQRWAVSTNLIGSFIDILVAFLYARNPDVSAKKATQVNNTGTAGMEDFAKTAEIVISKLWKQGRLKESARRMVRSALTNGVGWMKVILIADDAEIPQMESDMNDLRDNIQRIEALRAELGTDMDGNPLPGDIEYVPMIGEDEGESETLGPEEQNAKLQELADLEKSLSHRIEVAMRKYLAIDFIASDCVQVAIDARYITDYRAASWVSNDIYRTEEDCKAMFPRVTAEQLKKAKRYYQKRTNTSVNVDPNTIFNFDHQNVTEADADQFTAGLTADAEFTPDGSKVGSLPFLKVTERWDRRTNHIYTVIDGVECWAVEPYQPPCPSERFYPYFLIAFYEVDGERHPQSLSWRLAKLQDEYSSSRSSFRLLRQRAAPGTIFNKTGLSEEDVKKITDSREQEFVGVAPTDPTTPIQNLFAPKPNEVPDPRLYDNTPILMDMEKIAGVQEALQTSSSPEKTATEAEIQQSGFASRTTADRDVIEEMLTDLAIYTLQIALGPSGLTTKEVQRMAGPAAFWPEGMSLDDLLTMVEIEVVAGTTGKPKAMGDREAWGVLMPQIKEAMVQIQAAYTVGNVALADAIKELLRETMVRMGDDTDIDRFIPKPPQPAIDPLTGQPVPPPAAGPGSPVPGADPLPADPAAGGATDPALNIPELAAAADPAATIQ